MNQGYRITQTRCFVVLLAFSAGCATPPDQHDAWLGRDKAYHFAVSALAVVWLFGLGLIAVILPLSRFLP